MAIENQPCSRSFFSKFMVDRNDRITATDLVEDVWTQNGKLSNTNRKGTLEHLNAFNAKRKLRGVVYTIFAMKRMMDNPESAESNALK